MGIVRRIWHLVVLVAERERPTVLWQDKSRSLFAGNSAADGRKIKELAQCAFFEPRCAPSEKTKQ
jgi:hypothetical protein